MARPEQEPHPARVADSWPIRFLQIAKARKRQRVCWLAPRVAQLSNNDTGPLPVLAARQKPGKNRSFLSSGLSNGWRSLDDLPEPIQLGLWRQVVTRKRVSEEALGRFCPDKGESDRVDSFQIRLGIAQNMSDHGPRVELDTLVIKGPVSKRDSRSEVN